MFGFFKTLKELLFSKKKRYKHGIQKIHTEHYESYSAEKQKKIEALCEELFSRQDFLAAGRLQVLGLKQIKRKLGKTWGGLQKIVFQEVEASIQKYLLPTDVFMRYKDENYMVVFSEAGPEESQIKMRLIAEEVKRRLFAHEEKELRNIDVEESVSVVEKEDVASLSDSSKKVEHIFENHEKNKQDFIGKMEQEAKQKTQQAVENVIQSPTKKQKKAPIEITSTFDIDPYDTKTSTNLNDNNREEGEAYPDVKSCYVPLWNVQQSALTMYLCLAQGNKKTGNVFDCNEALFRSLGEADTFKKDVLILKKSIADLKNASAANKNLIIICPVHYSSMASPQHYREYLVECQKIDAEQKNLLIFLLQDIPENIPETTLQKISMPLKVHSHFLFAQTDVETTLFPALRFCGFDAVGARFQHKGGSEKKLIEKAEQYTQDTKDNYIQSVFALDIESFSMTTSTVCAGVNFLAGSIIHEPVDKPDNVYKFARQDLFTALLEA